MLNKFYFLPSLILAMLINFLAQAVHETGHHIIYQVMGHEPIWAFTKVVRLSVTTPTNPEEWAGKTNTDSKTSWPLYRLSGNLAEKP